MTQMKDTNPLHNGGEEGTVYVPTSRKGRCKKISATDKVIDSEENIEAVIAKSTSTENISLLTNSIFGEILRSLPYLSIQEASIVLDMLFEIDFIPDYEKFSYVNDIKEAIDDLLDDNVISGGEPFSFSPEIVLLLCECYNEFSNWYREEKKPPFEEEEGQKTTQPKTMDVAHLNIKEKLYKAREVEYHLKTSEGRLTKRHSFSLKTPKA